MLRMLALLLLRPRLGAILRLAALLLAAFLLRAAFDGVLARFCDPFMPREASVNAALCLALSRAALVLSRRAGSS